MAQAMIKTGCFSDMVEHFPAACERQNHNHEIHEIHENVPATGKEYHSLLISPRVRTKMAQPEALFPVGWVASILYALSSGSRDVLVRIYALTQSFRVFRVFRGFLKRLERLPTFWRLSLCWCMYEIVY